MISLALTRTALSLSPLTITEDFSTGLWIAEEGFGRPSFAWRKEHAPESMVFPGQALLAAVRDQSAIPVGIYARGTTTALLDAKMAELEAALGQFVYTATLTIDGVAKSFEAECTAPVWGGIDSGEVHAFLCRAAVVIPVNPPEA